MSAQFNLKSYHKTTTAIQYAINYFNINLNNISCYSLGNNNLIFQSSMPPYDITFLLFAQTLQSSQIISFPYSIIKTIVANETSLHFLSFDGSLYSWEPSMTSKQVSPISNPFFKKEKIIDICQSEDCTICFDSYMNVFCWGYISHLTGQRNHHSVQPIKLSKEVFKFPSALSKIVCGKNYVMFLNLTGEVCYCGEIQGKEDNSNNCENKSARLKYFDTKGFFNVFGGKYIVALFNNNKDSIVIFNEEIGLIEIKIKTYYIVKKTSIKFIDNVMFIDAVKDKQEKFIIEICLEDIEKDKNNQNYNHKDNNIKNGVIRIYRNDDASSFLWSPYYHKNLSFSNQEEKKSCLKLVKENDFFINVKTLINSQKEEEEQQQQAQKKYDNKRTKQYEQLQSQQLLNKEDESLKATPSFFTYEREECDYCFKPYNLNTNKIIEYNMNASLAVKELKKIKQNIHDNNNKARKLSKCESNDKLNSHFEENYKKLQRPSKSFYMNHLDQVPHYSYGSPSNHNQLYKYAVLNDSNPYSKRDSSSIIKKIMRFREIKEKEDNRQCKSSTRTRSTHCLIKTKSKDFEMAINQSKHHNKLLEGLLAECMKNDLFTPHKRHSNRNIKTRYKECTDKIFKSNPFLIYKVPSTPHIKDRIIIPQNNKNNPLNRISTESCILRYLKEKKMTNDKAFI